MLRTTLIIADGTLTLEDIRQHITYVLIPESVTEIRHNTFRKCSNLESITIPNSVTKISDSAFEDCSSLKSVTIPNSVTEIGDCCFYGCSSLKSIYIDKEEGSLDLRDADIPETTKVYWKGEWDEWDREENYV